MRSLQISIKIGNENGFICKQISNDIIATETNLEEKTTRIVNFNGKKTSDSLKCNMKIKINRFEQKSDSVFLPEEEEIVIEIKYNTFSKDNDEITKSGTFSLPLQQTRRSFYARATFGMLNTTVDLSAYNSSTFINNKYNFYYLITGDEIGIF